MATFVQGRVEVSVPATSANLGPGFDALGLALAHRDVVTAEVAEGGGPQILVRGAGEGEVPLDESHLVHRALARAFDAMGCPVPPVRLVCDNQIPHARGLGSSSAAIVAGVLAARGLVAGGSLLMDDDAVFELAARMEGHPDNVAPALFGGFTVAGREGESYFAVQVSVDPRVSTVVFVPPKPLSTSMARGLLPESIPHADAAANAGRAALLVAALNRQPERLLLATRDFLHQDYREPAMPDSVALVRSLRSDGVPAVVSGAGPTVLAFTDPSGQQQLLARAPDGWQALPLAVDHEGARFRLFG